MILHAFRIVKSRQAKGAFSGDGARRYGGRWNSPGSSVIYTASSVSLAMLEMLVHLPSRDLLLRYVVFPLEFDDSLVDDIDTGALPSDWRSSPAPPAVQQVGDLWVASGASAVLRVPSVIVERERNYLLNPRHSKFSEITIGDPEPIRFDPRLR